MDNGQGVGIRLSNPMKRCRRKAGVSFHRVRRDSRFSGARGAAPCTERSDAGPRGLFGAVFAHEATKKGKTCLVIDKRDHIGGNIYTEEVEGIQVHKYGAHIFHTSKKEIWDYVNQFTEFNHFVNSPIAVYKDELYNLPFNMNTFHQLWGVRTP